MKVIVTMNYLKVAAGKVAEVELERRSKVMTGMMCTMTSALKNLALLKSRLVSPQTKRIQTSLPRLLLKLNID